ncbi:hypothetical protein [Halosegnis marinus]|uniref:Uncharacterized protein n=1 Tax=Halosegnis marinus TaxID=3034023 RepID=A0ABD5ZQ41_9EURY|nr:hypothetical protein [Halosegnis sp. DT85]
MDANAPAERYLWWATVGEIVLLGWLALLLAASVAGSGGFLAGYSRTVRALVLGFVLVELAVPAWILVDVRRRNLDPVWVHVAAMPLVNLFGLAAYVEERKRR